MEGRGSGGSGIPTELESLQRRHEEKGLEIQELRRRAEAAERRLQEKRKAEEGAEAQDQKKEALLGLQEKLNRLREEYNDLSAGMSGEEKGERSNSRPFV